MAGVRARQRRAVRPDRRLQLAHRRVAGPTTSPDSLQLARVAASRPAVRPAGDHVRRRVGTLPRLFAAQHRSAHRQALLERARRTERRLPGRRVTSSFPETSLKLQSV